MKCNTKTYLTYLKLYNLNIPKILEDRRDIVWKHKELMTMNSKMIRQVKIEPKNKNVYLFTCLVQAFNILNLRFCTYIQIKLNQFEMKFVSFGQTGPI